MNANGFVVAGIIAAGFCACAQIQARVGDHLPDGKFIDSVDAEAFSYGTVSVGKQRDVDLQRSVGLGLAHAPELESYVQSVVDRLLVQSPMTGIPVDVHIRASEEFGAMATADANIFVDVGLIRKVKSEDQLAFALGHELSHIILGHTDTDIVAKTQRQAAMLTELSVAVGGQVRSMRGKQGPGGMLDDSKLEEQKQFLLLNTMVLSPAWNRGQEREADLLGIDLLVKAGYSPAAVDEVMAILVEAEADPDRVTLDRVVTDLKSMEWLKPDSAAATDAATKGDTGMPNLGIFGGAGKMASGWVGGVMKGVQADHPRAEERRVDTSKYVAREYTAVATQVEDPKPLLAAKQQSYTKQLLKSYDQAYSALQAAEKGNMKLAEKLAFASTNGAMSNHSYPRFYFSRVREQEGDLRRALQSLELAYDSPEPALRIYQRAGEFYERLGDQAGAIRILETAERKFGKPPALMPDLIALYQRAGRTGDADRLTLECVTKHPEMAELCGGQKQAGAGENIRTGLLDR